MDNITYALSKKLIAAALTGIANITVENGNLIIIANDSRRFSINIPDINDDKIKDIYIDENNENVLIIEKSRLEIKNLVCFFYSYNTAHSFCVFNIYTSFVATTKQVLPAA